MASTIATLPLGQSKDPWIENLSRNRPMRDNPDKRMNTDSRAPGTQDRPDVSDKERRSRDYHVNDETGAAKGGLIKRVGGKPKGKDHGTIPVQRGEFVMKTAAVKKHGVGKMAAVNSGKAKISVPKSKGKK